MDIQKEREAFEQALVSQKNVSINNLHICTIFDAEKNKYSPSDVCDPKEDFIVDWINSSWSIWQAAKAQAVLEGFALVKMDDLELLRDSTLKIKYASLNNDSDRIFSDIEDIQLSIERLIELQEPTND